MINIFWKRCTGFAVLGFLFLPLVVLAVEIGEPPKIKEIQPPDYLPTKPDETFRLPPVKPTGIAATPEESIIQVRIDRVTFKGNKVIASSELEAIAAAYLQRMISATELEELRQKLTRHYINRGYVNSGVLFEKVSEDGVASFNVVEGRLSAIRLQGMGRLKDEYVTRRLAKDSDGPLNINVLRERYQLLLSDPLFQRLNARLMPDSKQGDAILDVDVERTRPYRVSAAYNNYRSPSVGSEAMYLSGSVSNLSGYGDVLEASYQAPTRWSSGKRRSFAWRIPVGYWGTQFSYATEHGSSSVIDEPLQALDIESTLDSRDIGLSQALIETLSDKLTFGLNLINRENRTTLMGTPFSFIAGEPDGLTQESLTRFWQEYSHRTESQVMALRSTFTSGKNNIQEIPGLPASSTVPQQYSAWMLQAQYSLRLMENGTEFHLRGTTQKAKDRMLSLDGISIGGVNSVRGYRENQLLRDSGEFMNIEFEYPVIREGGNGLNVALIPFYDIGSGQNVGDSKTTISSAGLAGRMQWRGVNLDVAIAKRLIYPESIVSGSNLQDKGMHFQLSYNY